jgi:3-methyladenine DNA glycosylase AlkD
MKPDEFVQELRGAGTRRRAEHEKRYLKSSAVFLGVPVPETRRLSAPVANAFKQSGDLRGAIAFATSLWSTRIHEPKLAAAIIVSACEPLYDDRVWRLGRVWLGDIDNWALCDGIAPNLVGPFVCASQRNHKSRRKEILRWTRDANPWVRRGALLATIRGIRDAHEYKFTFDVCRLLLNDPDYFVQKALGWMLRECAHHNPREAITFIQSHRVQMRKSTITNAVSRLPKTLQRAARDGRAGI